MANYIKLYDKQGIPVGFTECTEDVESALGDARVKLYDENQRLVGFRVGGGESTPKFPDITPTVGSYGSYPASNIDASNVTSAVLSFPGITDEDAAKVAVNGTPIAYESYTQLWQVELYSNTVQPISVTYDGTVWWEFNITFRP